MKNIVEMCAVVAICSVILLTGKFLAGETLKTLQGYRSEYSDTAAHANLEEYKCMSYKQGMFDFDIQVEFVKMEGAVGKWIPSLDTIRLAPNGGMDIDTVAHEVHHMVENKMKEYNVQDSHYAAYLQGNWTGCVWKIVQEQQRKDRLKSKFYFFNDVKQL
jgi:hypothetical protein